MHDLISRASLQPHLRGRNKQQVLEELVDCLVAGQPEIDTHGLLAALWQRERLSSTAIGDGVAIPHARVAGLSRMVLAIGRHVEGVDFESLDGTPTRLFFVLIAPADAPGSHLKALAQVSRTARDAGFRQAILAAEDDERLRQCLVELTRPCILHDGHLQVA